MQNNNIAKCFQNKIIKLNNAKTKINGLVHDDKNK
jgi:hypothetical protein